MSDLLDLTYFFTQHNPFEIHFKFINCLFLLIAMYY